MLLNSSSIQFVDKNVTQNHKYPLKSLNFLLVDTVFKTQNYTVLLRKQLMCDWQRVQ